MAILVDQSTRVICQGFTGKQATFYSQLALASGFQLLGGVSPGKGGQQHLGLPVFDSVAAAKHQTGANASVVFVPPAHAASALLEAIDAGIGLVVCVTEKIPVLDMVRVRYALEGSTTTLVGPNCIGVITPGQCRMGVMPNEIFTPGKIGVVSRAATLTYEAVSQMSKCGLGQSTCVGIGGDPVHGLSFVDVLKLFREDNDTDGVVMIGEIGGDEEERAADFLSSKPFGKPVIAFIAGTSAPEGRRMGHAGAIQQVGAGTATDKIQRLKAAGVIVVSSPMEIGNTMADECLAR